jgi:hypothetical protein
MLYTVFVDFLVDQGRLVECGSRPDYLLAQFPVDTPPGITKRVVPAADPDETGTINTRITAETNANNLCIDLNILISFPLQPLYDGTQKRLTSTTLGVRHENKERRHSRG